MHLSTNFGQEIPEKKMAGHLWVKSDSLVERLGPQLLVTVTWVRFLDDTLYFSILITKR